MRRLLVSLALLAPSPAPAQGSPPIEAELEALFARAGGRYAVAAEDLQTGEQILVRHRERFHAASTMKTPVMVELYRQAEVGELRLDDRIEVRNSFRSIVDGSPYSMQLGDDSDDSVYGLVGRSVSYRHLIHQMITRSSNLATNILIEQADARRVTATMRRLGMDSIEVLRGVEDGKAFAAGLNNTTTAHDLLVLFRRLGRGEAVSRQADAEMLDILFAQEWRDKLPARLPAGVRIAHKTGNITGVEHDGGLLELPDGRRFVIVILSREVPDAAAARDTIARAARLIHDHFARVSPVRE